MEMENDQVPRSVCKVCGKSFLCGRSLGGHMRSHLVNFADFDPPDSTRSKKKRRLLRNGVEKKQRSRNLMKASGGGGEDAFLQQKYCKECDKSFQSFKAYLGHMTKCRSDSWDSSHGQSDDETSATRRRRSKRSKGVAMNSSSDVTISISSSSGVSEINDQQETEEVAMSLLLLSKNWYEHNSVLKSSSKRAQDNGIKKGKFTCVICLKSFTSYQALGGHRASHKIKAYGQIKCTANKEHQCPICFRVFPSGQALGGHKRSHFITDNTKLSTDFAIRNPVRHIIDLNMPAPAEEEDI